MAHVAPYKKKIVDEFVKLITDYPIIGAINVENLPATQFQNMRANLRGKVVIRMTKRRLLNLAFDKVKDKKPGVDQLKQHLGGMPALIFTKDNPFTLYKTIQKSKSSAPAKPGQTAPKDIVVPAGPTSFAPGPIISELGSVGIKAGIEDGKIAIKADTTVAKEGAVISPKLASLLTRLGIRPMEVGLDLVAVYEDGHIFTKKILAIDEKVYVNNLTQAARWALNLAMDAAVFTSQTTELLVQKAFRESKALAMEQNIMADAVASDLLQKAERQIIGLKSQLKL